MTTAARSPRRSSAPLSDSPNPHRLDELVWHLTGCSPVDARRTMAGFAPADLDDAIGEVARAVTVLRPRRRRIIDVTEAAASA